MTTFTNDFHGTEVSIKASVGDIVSAFTYRRVCNTLCGHQGCECGTFRGSSSYLRETDSSYQSLRGPRQYMVEQVA